MNVLEFDVFKVLFPLTKVQAAEGTEKSMEALPEEGVEAMPEEGMDLPVMEGGGGMGLDESGMGMGMMESEKPSLMQNTGALIGISAGVLALGILSGIVLAKLKIKKGINLYED